MLLTITVNDFQGFDFVMLIDGSFVEAPFGRLDFVVEQLTESSTMAIATSSRYATQNQLIFLVFIFPNVFPEFIC